MVNAAGPGPALPEGFLMGASTSAHQIEGGNVSSDWWALENHPGSFVAEPSGDAADSFHRWPEDMDLLCELGFDSYRFSIEWARIEPRRGMISRAAVEHYRAMVRGALERGLTPVVTLHHFTSPQWFSDLGGWTAPEASELFAAYAHTATDILRDGVRYVATINEPNIMALMYALKRHAAEHGWESLAQGSGAAREGGAAAVDPASFEPDPEVVRALVRAHRAATAVLKAALPDLQVGWTVANQVYQAEPGAEAALTAYAWLREDVFLEAAREDDWIGVQAYTRHRIGTAGPLPPPAGCETTLTGWEVYPEALGEAVRHTADVVGPHVPVIVTENGIATDDDEQRIAYTARALTSLASAMDDGVDVRGYLHWSALDNYEWGTFRPTFGLIAVDRTTFVRSPKESARWLGALSRSRRLPDPAGLASVSVPSSR
ncbi:glycoside hydrolase family 1 protein [Streptomyces sp. NBC_01257]|uniref:glycoside hydrolase family 1 protein n=1 Tax=Streptomyces sp. NBC_01257 TaxID=2903799 RepID=UPI002DDA6784|nr:family 1 glycosylhydrolase [Streptomyces sp. NBC_01257]WRZ69231.1 family 1 glycosylhydrolase [Streptomyces sp. NBC_01257]